MRTTFLTRAGTPAGERFSTWRRRAGDQYEITTRDNLTGAERSWGDYSGIEPAIARWEAAQLTLNPQLTETVSNGN